jgi:hypothetical protein
VNLEDGPQRRIQLGVEHDDGFLCANALMQTCAANSISPVASTITSMFGDWHSSMASSVTATVRRLIALWSSSSECTAVNVSPRTSRTAVSASAIVRLEIATRRMPVRPLSSWSAKPFPAKPAPTRPTWIGLPIRSRSASALSTRIIAANSFHFAL